jgi:hypothetical protein
MRRGIIIALCLIATLCGAQSVAHVQRRLAMLGATSEIDITVGLQHYWNPGGTLSDDDQIGSLTSTKYGTITTTTNGWVFGTGNRNDFTLSSAISNAQNYAVAAWVKPDRTTMDGQTSGGWILSDRAPAETGWDFQFYYSSGSKALLCGLRDKINFVSYIPLATNVTHDAWQHVCFVADYDSLEIRAYKNGELVYTTAVPSEVATSVFSNVSTLTRIGNLSWDTGGPETQFRGTLDKLRFYNGAAPDADFIRAIYQQDGKAKGIL